MKLLGTNTSNNTSCRYRIETERKLHIEEYSGCVRLDDLKEIAAAVAADPARSDAHNRLFDLSEAELNLTSDDVLRLGLLMRSESHRSGGWHAFAVKDAAAFSLVRMLSQWARVSDRSRFFRSRDEAERWLEINTERGSLELAGMQVA
jgi:hypothetical protein